MSEIAPTKVNGPKILLAEDEHRTAAQLEHCLEELGYEVVATAQSARRAVRLTRETLPALVLMGLKRQGGIPGYKAAEEIWRRWQIPVIYTTAHPSTGSSKSANAAAGFGCIAAPFTVRELNALIATTLQHQGLSRDFRGNSQLYATILSGIRDGVIATDSSGCVQLVNRAAEQLTGWTQQDAIGKPIEEVYRLLNASGQVPSKCPVRRVLTTGVSPGWVHYSLSRRGGGETAIQDAAAPIHNAQGQISGAVAVFFDVSERMRAEELRTTERENLRERVAQAAEALGATRAELRALAGRLLSAQEEERRRLARELHDDASQRLAFLEWEADRIGREPVPEQLRSGLQRIRQEAVGLSSSLRDLSHRLHPSVLEDLGLSAALRGLVDEYQRHGLKVTLSLQSSISVSAEVRTNLYRIAQEALRNVQKHAPDAIVQMKLIDDGHHVELIFEDNGPGFDLEEARTRGGLGLLSIQERARLMGGTLSMKAQPGVGTILLVCVPHEKEAAAAAQS